MSNVAVDGVTLAGTVYLNVTYENVPATYQQVNYVVNLPPIWQETNAKLYYNDTDNNFLNVLPSVNGVVNTNNYGYTTDNTLESAINGTNNYEYTDVVPHIEGLGKYKGSTGHVGFSAGVTIQGGNTGPNIKFKFGRVGYNVNWICT